MTRNQKIILQLGDVIIPLLGFYYLNWSVYFIALYLLLDLLGSFIFYNVKCRKRIKFANNDEEKTKYLKSLVILSLLILGIVLLSHIFALQIFPDIHFVSEIINFLMYVEPPIPLPQFWFLLPLLLLPPYQEYKMVFITQQKFRKTTVSTLQKSYQFNLVATIVLLVLLTTTSLLVTLPHDVWLFSYLLFNMFYSLYLKDQFFKTN